VSISAGEFHPSDLTIEDFRPVDMPRLAHVTQLGDILTAVWLALSIDDLWSQLRKPEPCGNNSPTIVSFRKRQLNDKK
jgi:hypothetical protein